MLLKEIEANYNSLAQSGAKNMKGDDLETVVCRSGSVLTRHEEYSSMRLSLSCFGKQAENEKKSKLRGSKGNVMSI